MVGPVNSVHLSISHLTCKHLPYLRESTSWFYRWSHYYFLRVFLRIILLLYLLETLLIFSLDRHLKNEAFILYTTNMYPKIKKLINFVWVVLNIGLATTISYLSRNLQDTNPIKTSQYWHLQYYWITKY